MKSFSKTNVKKMMIGMIREAQEEERFDEEPLFDSGEANLTYLAESVAYEFGQADEGGPLDEEDHWIWDVACDAARAAGALR